MKLRQASFLGSLLLLGFLTLPVPAGDTYKIDANHSSILFSVKHFGAGLYYGRFNDAEGKIVFDESNPAATEFQISVKTESVDTHNDRRDKHLRSPEFFNAVQFPEVTFESKSVKVEGGSMMVSGSLSMLGKTNDVTFKVENIGSGNDPWGNFRRGFHATATIKRSEWGMNWGLDNGALSDEVHLIISMESVKEKE